ncbi:MAG: pilus assembly protein [Bosea sp. (in: a-proteobacteria)]|nr:pilus assembly protein [Bosea sp. (in: a-proteobacteria)]
MLFGLSLVPLIGVVGVAVDYSRASNARQALNAAIDSAALMAARDAQKLTDAQLTARINAWLKANLPPEVQSEFTAAAVTIDRTARTVKIVANANVPTTVARVLGSETLPVSSTSQSTWGTNKIELALVLDNTGSMAQKNKMTALKAAAKDLIKIMQDATTETDQIRISIVPFNTQVRIARTFQNEQWMRYGESRRVICNSRGTSCTLDDYYRTPISDLDGLVCSGSGNNKSCTKQNITKTTWAKTSEGCITDRDQNYDVKDGGSYTASEQQFPAFWCSQSTLAEALPLTSNWTTLNGKVDSMTPVGATNVTIGAVWGWATLTPGAPYTEAKPATEPRLKKYMILLTDGDNTQNRWDGNGSDPSPAIDARTKLACTNIKADGISLYTIRVMDGNASMLRDCASKPEMYYEVTDASQLSPIFKAIAGEISAVRLTQ